MSGRGKGTALVLCGGGSHGALEVGFALALAQRGIGYDRILGSSIGALNGAFLAGAMSPDALADLWRRFARRRMAALNWRGLVPGGAHGGLLTLRPLARLVERLLPARRFEDLAIPLSIVTTDLVSGEARYWEERGDLLAPLLASMSLPGLFPPVMLEGRPHVDGGLTDNAPLARAAALGARRALMIECACAAPCRQPPKGAIGRIGRAFEIVLAAKHRTELAATGREIETVRVVPVLESEAPLMDFSVTEELIAAGHAQALAQLPETPPGQSGERAPGRPHRMEAAR